MKHQSFLKLISLVAIMIVSGVFNLAFSQKKLVESTQKGTVKLVYNYPTDKSIKYLSTSKIVQNMNVNGESMLVNVSSYFGCNVRATGKQGEDLKLEIKIDTVAQTVDTPQGAAGGEVADAKGKTFNMVISPDGKTVDISEAASVVFNVPGSGETNATQTFLGFFPIIPSGTINIGDTWVSIDTADFKSPAMSIWMPIKADYKFEGIEFVNGKECAKISAAESGTRKMTTQNQGMSVIIDGPFTGTVVLYFDISEGYYVKATETSRMTGNIEIPDQGMSFPVVMDIITTKEIQK
jgi:hypothetical protein